MNLILKRCLPCVLLAVFLGTSAHAQTRIATVNLQRVFDKYWKTEQATANLKDRVAQMEKTHKEMLDAWKQAKDDYQKALEGANNQAVSAEERDRRKKAAEDKLKDIKSTEDNIAQFERQASASISEQKSRLRKSILEEIKTAIGSKAKSGGYTMVIDSGAQTYSPDPSGPYYTPTLLYSTDENDLTEPVLAQLNAGAPVDIGKPEEETPAETPAATPAPAKKR